MAISTGPPRPRILHVPSGQAAHRAVGTARPTEPPVIGLTDLYLRRSYLLIEGLRRAVAERTGGPGEAGER